VFRGLILQGETKPRIAVLLAAYNGLQWMDQQVNSILNQTGVGVTIFISLDISTDNSFVICQSLAETHTNIILLPYGQRFGSAGQNFFRLIHDVDFSGYDYIAFADQDDIWLPNKLSSAVEMLKQTNADGYSSNVTAFWEDGKEQLIDKAQPQRQWDFLFEAAGPGCTYVLTNKLATEVQHIVRNRYAGFKHVYLHDWFIYVFARAKGYQWVIDSTTYMRYRQHSNNEVGVNTGFKALKHRYFKVVNELGLCQSKLLAELSGITDDPFVKMWSDISRWGIIKLAFHANQCRRKPKERVLFFIMCLVLAIKPKKCE
jgi:rhamnosyltransferase